MFFGDNEDDKLDQLPEKYRAAAQFPRDQIGVYKDSKQWDFRDAFRKICLNHLQGTMFNENSLAKMVLLKDFKECLLAFRILMDDFRGPINEFTGLPEDATKKDIAEQMTRTRMMEMEPKDIIHTLRPIKTTTIPYCPESRACRMLNVSPAGYETGFDIMPYTIYVLQVNYCMRKTFVRKRFKDFIIFQKQIYDEIQMLPCVLRKDPMYKINLGSRRDRADTLCNFLERLHGILGDKNCFSPRLMQFLEIDVVRVHLEEEGRIAKYLDTTNLIAGSVWHIVDEVWLIRWRKFVMGRGARRYMPPGKITNFRLLDEVKDEAYYLAPPGTPAASKTSFHFETKSDLVCGRDYRALSWNMFNYLVHVHGGGPWINRKEKDIYKSRAYGSGLHSVIIVQSFLRMAIAIFRFRRRYFRHLSTQAEGVRLVLFETLKEQIDEETEQRLEDSQKEREAKYLEEAMLFTQREWRKKKDIAYSVGDTMAETKEAQEIFAHATGMLEEAVDGPLVVEAIPPVVVIPSCGEVYDVVFGEGMGFSVGLQENPATGETCVVQLRDNLRDYVPKHGSDKKGEVKKIPKMELLSVLIEINGIPTNPLTHAQVKLRLRQASFPLRLKLRRPLVPLVDAEPLHLLGKFSADDTALQAFKRLLSSGMPMHMYIKKKKIEGCLWLSETHLSWRERDFNPSEDPLKWLRSLSKSHLVAPFKKAGVTKPDLLVTNGKKGVKGAVQDFVHSFDEFGVTQASEAQQLFCEITTWQTKDLVEDLATRGARNLFSLGGGFVRAGKDTPGFGGKAKDERCFTLTLDGVDDGKPGDEKKRVLELEVYLPKGAFEEATRKLGANAPRTEAELLRRMRNTCVWGFDHVIQEVRTNKFYIGRSGMIVQKPVLKPVLGTMKG